LSLILTFWTYVGLTSINHRKKFKLDKERAHFLKLYEPVHPRLCRYVQALIRNREEARDVISEVTLIALEKFSTIKDTDKFIYFLFGIARKQFMKKLEKDKRATLTLNDTSFSTQPADQKIWKYELELLLNKLSAHDQQRLVLYEISGFSYKEIAELTGESLQEVKAGLYQTRQQLKSIAANERAQLLKMEGAK
jgi:RNA polymerase sigma-70 factor (ECF subfamily)